MSTNHTQLTRVDTSTNPIASNHIPRKSVILTAKSNTREGMFRQTSPIIINCRTKQDELRQLFRRSFVGPAEYPVCSNYTEQLIKTLWPVASPFRTQRGETDTERDRKGSEGSEMDVREKVADTTVQPVTQGCRGVARSACKPANRVVCGLTRSYTIKSIVTAIEAKCFRCINNA